MINLLDSNFLGSGRERKTGELVKIKAIGFGKTARSIWLFKVKKAVCEVRMLRSDDLSSNRISQDMKVAICCPCALSHFPSRSSKSSFQPPPDNISASGVEYEEKELA